MPGMLCSVVPCQICPHHINLVLQGCVVEVEGRKRGKYWTFSVVDPSGLNLLRMSSENEREAGLWVEVLPPLSLCNFWSPKIVPSYLLNCMYQQYGRSLNTAAERVCRFTWPPLSSVQRRLCKRRAAQSVSLRTLSGQGRLSEVQTSAG